MEIYNFAARQRGTNVTAIGTAATAGVLETLFVESGNELQMLAQLAAAATILAENRETRGT